MLRIAKFVLRVGLRICTEKLDDFKYDMSWSVKSIY